MIKLTIIGAGSAVFTKNIVSDLLHNPLFKQMHISLMDIDDKRLKIAKELIDVVAIKLNAKPKITLHTNRRDSLKDADFVQTTIQVGGYKPSTKIDFEIPNEYGLEQTIGDTLGIGGIMRGLRTIPVLLDIGKDIMEVCPNALWLQYVNPMCSNMIAINQTIPQIKTLGLCHSVQGTAEMLAEDLGEDLKDIKFTCAGINHMAFFLKFEKNKDNNLIVIDDFEKEIKKTKEMFSILSNLKASNSLLLLDKSSKKNIFRSSRNIPNIKVTDVNHFSSYDITKYKKLLLTLSSIKELEKKYS